MSKLEQLRAMREAKAADRLRAEKSDERPKKDQRAKAGNMPRSTRGEEGGSSGAFGIARSTVQDAALEHHAGVVTRSSDTPRAFRRPLAKDSDKTLSATKPWEAEGMSRRTWYRRQKGNKND